MSPDWHAGSVNLFWLATILITGVNMTDMGFNQNPMRAMMAADTPINARFGGDMTLPRDFRGGVHHHHHHYHNGGPMPFPQRFEQQADRMEKLLEKMTEMFQKLIDKLTGSQAGGTTPASTNAPANPGTGGDGTVIAGKGRIWGDPHFEDPDGGKFDVQGQAGKTYNLLSDKNFQMNGRFDKWGGGGATVVGEVGISAGGDKVTVQADGDVMVNGRQLKDGEKVALANGGSVEKNGDKATVKIGEYEVKFDAEKSPNGDYLNMDVITKNANADGVKPHGLLGQTFDGDGKARNGDMGSGAQGGGAIETLANTVTQKGDKHTVSMYEVRDLHDTNFHGFNRFGAQGSTGSFQNTSMEDIMAMLDKAFGIMSQGLAFTSRPSTVNVTYNDFG